MGYEILNDDLYSQEELHNKKNKPKKKRNHKNILKISGILIILIILISTVFGLINFFNNLFEANILEKNIEIQGQITNSKQRYIGDLETKAKTYIIDTGDFRSISNSDFLKLENFNGEIVIQNSSFLIVGNLQNIEVDNNVFSLNGEKKVLIEITKPATFTFKNGNMDFDLKNGYIKTFVNQETLSYDFKSSKINLLGFSGNVVFGDKLKISGNSKDFVLKNSYSNNKEFTIVYT